ncbi:hypothetical protein [Lonomia obliqua multiple nucleopolyhedrovirus]|uniref:Uncharacterized protein n=1 Tax=Lonomia obliqua multiple nucleopolyhedrovirus TaxID=134394 RepID=A0A126FCB0_9ABAC|nr:hypothetical protein [Lonomia obliqua multiple nucleopolyhedrovirus]AKN81036.1 hypothetical protein [Lonomia obliqua multiple nucleopolyhedrovirus]
MGDVIFLDNLHYPTDLVIVKPFVIYNLERAQHAMISQVRLSIWTGLDLFAQTSDDSSNGWMSSFRTCITRPIWLRKARSFIYNLERAINLIDDGIYKHASNYVKPSITFPDKRSSIK